MDGWDMKSGSRGASQHFVAHAHGWRVFTKGHRASSEVVTMLGFQRPSYVMLKARTPKNMAGMLGVHTLEFTDSCSEVSNAPACWFWEARNLAVLRCWLFAGSWQLDSWYVHDGAVPRRVSLQTIREWVRADYLGLSCLLNYEYMPLRPTCPPSVWLELTSIDVT